MKQYAIGGVIVSLWAMLLVPVAFAATRTGQIQILRIESGTGGSPRVSIFMGGTTACGNPGWFAYQTASTGVGLLWTQGLLAAYKAGNPVRIDGTGTCDAFAVERVLGIDLLP
jgi:hypothetical protein